MAAFARSNDLRGAEFIGADLRGARFAEADLSGVVMRGVNAGGVDIDDPLLCDGGSFLLVNGVDVIPFVEAELNRRFPGRGIEGPPLLGQGEGAFCPDQRLLTLAERETQGRIWSPWTFCGRCA